jgi:phenylalanyl-tRNA synthetase beta chain
VRFSLGWLRDYVELPESAEEVGRLATGLGFALEGIDEVEGEAVVDLEITTNRPDAMCHVGLARELAAKLGRELKPPTTRGLREVTDRAADQVTIEVESLGECPWYTTRVLRGVRVGPSPDWLQRRLRAIGVGPINNVVDVTNYVLWETGQPLHAFDLDRLRARSKGGEPRVAVRRARAGETLTTLDGVERRLDPEDLINADAVGPIGLAGVMGGQPEKVTEATTSVLLEAAHFDRRAVRRTAKRAGLHTDASHRFERGSDPAACAWAAARAAALLAEIAGGEILSGLAEAGAAWSDDKSFGLIDAERLSRFAGYPVDDSEIEETLAGLGFATQPVAGGQWRVAIPSWRVFDIEAKPADRRGGWGGNLEEADLFEEVLRVLGLDRVPSALPAFEGADAGSQPDHYRRSAVRDLLAASGLAEAVTYSFLAREPEAAFGSLIAGDALELANPISESYQVMRRSALPTLLEAASFNLRHGAEAVRLFEVGRVYSSAGERETCAIVLGGATGTAWSGEKAFGFFELKGLLETLAASFGHQLTFRAVNAAGFVPGTCAEIALGSCERAGRIGQVAAEARLPLFGAELLLAPLGKLPVSRVEPPSRYPGIAVDSTIEHPESVAWALIANAVSTARPPDLRQFGLKDRFQGAGVAPGRVRSTLWFSYRSDERSLTQEEVNEIHFPLAQDLGRRFSG